MNLCDVNSINYDDCMDYMKHMENECVHLTLTDIPYGVVNRDSNGLRNLNKEDADIMTFNLQEFLSEVYRVTSGTVIIFCSKEQISEIYKFFDDKQKKKLGTVRHLVWEKTNPSPMNGQYIYIFPVSKMQSGLKRKVLLLMHIVKTLCLNILVGEANSIRQRKIMTCLKN